MADLSLKPTNNLKLKNMQKLIPRLKLANLLNLSEQTFADLTNKIESDPLFKRFTYAFEPNKRVFGFKRFAKTDISSNFFELNENVTAGNSSSANIEVFLSEKKEVVKLCQKIGVENFKKYFLFQEDGYSTEEIAEKCRLTTDEVEKTLDLVNHLAVQEEFYNTPKVVPGAHTNYNKIAAIETDPQEDVSIKFSSLKYARGRYVIDYKKIESLKDDPTIPKKEVRELKKLIRTMELVNTRKSTVCQILQKVIEKQTYFLKSNASEKIQPFTQLQLAKELGVHCSTVSRAISGKSVSTPWNQEVPIKTFFIKGPVNKIKFYINNILAEEERLIKEGKLDLPYRDDEIKNLLKNEYEMTIATRTIAKYRMEMKIPNVYVRQKNYKTPAAAD